MVVPLSRDPFGKGMVVVSYGDNKIKAIRGVRMVTGEGLREAKDFVESLPKDIKGLVRAHEKYTLDEARSILREHGCEVDGEGATLAEMLSDLEDFVLPPAR